MHSFRLNPQRGGLEFELPGLDLGASETGIVGRKVRVVGSDSGGGVALGEGIVGYN